MNLHSLVFFYLLSSGGTELEIRYQILQVSSASPQRIRIRRNPWEPEEEKGYKRRMSPQKLSPGRSDRFCSQSTPSSQVMTDCLSLLPTY